MIEDHVLHLLCFCRVGGSGLWRCGQQHCLPQPSSSSLGEMKLPRNRKKIAGISSSTALKGFLRYSLGGRKRFIKEPWQDGALISAISLIRCCNRNLN